MAGDYALLAPYYDRMGMGKYTTRLTPRLLNLSQQNGWMGRRILDLGCGTGACLAWFAGHGYSAVGVDNSPEMLAQCQQKITANKLNATLIEADIRKMQTVERIDMALALRVLNSMDTLRDLEAVFQGVANILAEGRFFVFDMQTVQGLAEQGTMSEQRIHEDQDLVAFSRSRYDFERQICMVECDVFVRHENTLWKRVQARRVLRAFPVQAVASLLRRHNFDILKVLDTNLEDFTASGASGVIFIAKKV